MILNLHRLLSLGALLAVFTTAAGAASLAETVGGEDEPAVFDGAFLGDGDTLRRGKKLWGKTCKLCHGNTAYPGKAPKLGSKCYEPEFIYDRVTNGFQGMPAWKSQIPKYQRMAVSAYIVSKRFPSNCVRPDPAENAPSKP